MNNTQPTLEVLMTKLVSLKNEIQKVIVGQDAVLDEILVSMLAGGHCLIEGVPGLAKTLMVKTLARALDLTFRRIQFTPDLMPTDLIGTEILEEDHASDNQFLYTAKTCQVVLQEVDMFRPAQLDFVLLK